jgi:Predicted metal-dependent hydrolase of the TIM-barrel fold
MRIDAHVHFIDYNPEEYAWIGEDHRKLKRPFMPEDLKPLLDEAGFDGIVAVQARQSLKETEWLLRLADRCAWIKGVVGWVDLRSPELERQLAGFSAHPKLRGVRHVVHDEPDDDFMLRGDFRRGIGRLREYGLTYDLLLFPKHLPTAARLADEFPEQPFVLDHIAKPDIKSGIGSGDAGGGEAFPAWKRDMHELAKRPNVSCKLSGMVTEADWERWTEADFAPYLDAAFEAFGPDRLMIGSDWPVCTVSRDYRSVMGIVIRYLERYPEDVRDKVLGGNCASFYGLKP